MSSGKEVKSCCKIIRRAIAIINLKTAIFLGFYNQATPRRPSDEPFFTLGSTVHDWGWPKNLSESTQPH